MRPIAVRVLNSAEMAGLLDEDELAGRGRQRRLRRRAKRREGRAAAARARARAGSGRKRRKKRPQKPKRSAEAPPQRQRSGGRAFRPGPRSRRAPMSSRGRSDIEELPVVDEGYDEYDDDYEYEDDFDDGYELDEYDDGYEYDEYESDYDDYDEDFSGESMLDEIRVELGEAVDSGELSSRGARSLWHRIKEQVRAGTATRRARRSARRQPALPATSAGPAQPSRPARPYYVEQEGWGPAVGIGENIIAKARGGRRMVVMTLRDGLYLLADVPSMVLLPTTEGGFGAAGGAVLGPAIVKAASKALEKLQDGKERRQNRRQARRENRREGNGLLSSLFQPGKRGIDQRKASDVLKDPTPLLLAGCCEWCDAEDVL